MFQIRFDETILKLKSVDKNLFVLVIGERDKETGLSWCPDCVKGIISIYIVFVFISIHCFLAEPFLNDAFKRIGNCVVLECPVIKDEYVIKI